MCGLASSLNGQVGSVPLESNSFVLSEVTYGGIPLTEFIELNSDVNTDVRLGPPHFKYDDPSADNYKFDSHPIAYVSGSSPTISANLFGNCDEPRNIRCVGKAYGFSGTLEKEFLFPDKLITPVNGLFEYNLVQAQNAFDENIVKVYPHFILEFWVQDPNSFNWIQIEKGSDNVLYVTLDIPSDYHYHSESTPKPVTWLHTACAAANEASDQSEVVEKINLYFSGREIKRFEGGGTFSYYAPIDINNPPANITECYDAYTLMEELSGRCGAFQDFYTAVLGAHNIVTDKKTILPKLNGPYTQEYVLSLAEIEFGSDAVLIGIQGIGTKFFLVRNWNENISVGDLIEVENLTNYEGADVGSYDFDLFLNNDPSGLEGISAQGNLNPRSLFYDHVFAELPTGLQGIARYYDASYGNSAETLQEYEYEGMAFQAYLIRDINDDNGNYINKYYFFVFDVISSNNLSLQYD